MQYAELQISFCPVSFLCECRYKVCALNPFFGDSRRGAGVKISSFPDLLAVLSAALVLIAKDDWKLLELHLGSTASFEHIHVKVD